MKLNELLNNVKVEWKNIGDFITRFSQKQKNHQDINLVYAVSKEFGLIKSSEFWANDERGQDYTMYSKDLSNYNVIKKNMFAYNPARLNIGSISCLLDGDDGLLSPMYIVFKVDEKIVLPKYLLYYIKSERILQKIDSLKENGARFRFDFEKWNKIQIPIPPLEIQEKIAKILDKFTNYATELRTELRLRNKQYEYYRNLLLSKDYLKKLCLKFGDETNAEQLEIFKIEEIFEIRNGYTPSKQNKDFWENGTIPWFRMDDIREQGSILKNSKQNITQKAVKGKGLFKSGSIILATSATIGEHAMLLSDSLANQRFTNFEISKKFKNLLMPKYIFYYFYLIDQWCKDNVNVSNFNSVNMDALVKLEIPIPPLKVQNEVVRILDKFSDISSNLEKGLPKEIDLRQKQYEFYRDLLLNFKKD